MIEATIAELDDVLQGASPSVAVRELRVRHGALARVVRGWGKLGPHDAQLAAMLECVIELRDAVKKTCPPRPRDTAAAVAKAARPTARVLAARAYKTTKPPPRRPAIKSTKPPPHARAANAARAGSGAPPSSRPDRSSPPSSRRGS